jgi:hypothetical protein
MNRGLIGQSAKAGKSFGIFFACSSKFYLLFSGYFLPSLKGGGDKKRENQAPLAAISHSNELKRRKMT